MKQRDSTFIATASYVLSPTALATEGTNFAANPVCVGPFMFDHRIVGDNVTLVKSPYYFKRAAIHLDKIVFKVITDAAAAAAALQAGDLQVVDNVSPTLLPSVQADSSLRVLRPRSSAGRDRVSTSATEPASATPYANVGTPLAQSPQLRQAFEEAINRQTLNKVVFGGLYQPSCTLVPPANTSGSR